MPEYIAAVKLEVNGQEIDDFKSVTEKEIERHKQVNLMNKTGVIKVTPRYGIEVEYLIPKDSPEQDWSEVANATLTIDKDNGKRVTYSGVYVMKEGAAKYDGENEATKTIDLVATERIEE